MQMSFKLNLVISLCLVALLHLSNGERARYDNYRVYKVVASNAEELAVLRQLEEGSDALIFLEGVHDIQKAVHVVVAPHKLPDFLQILAQNEIDHELVEQNLQNALNDDENTVSIRASGYDWSSYHTLDETYTWLQTLAQNNPGIVSLIEGGKTHEKRSILGVKISYGSGKPGIFIESGIHAREWIGPATATYIINQLLTSSDSAVRNIAENYDWYIFPHTNPDGFVYTHTTDRLWRKTRTPYGSCFGADPNRNWGEHWNEIGASSNPCSDTYAGAAAFSEIETQSLSDYIISLKDKIQLYLSFHAYSQYLLYPFGYTSKLPSNAADYQQVFKATTAALAKRYGTKYTGGNIYDAIYPAAGSSVDWAYDKANVKMAFCYELRPSSNAFLTGFKLPANQIVPTGEETLDSLVAMINEVQKLGYFK